MINLFRNHSNRFSSFLRDESGLETLEWLAILAVVGSLMVIVMRARTVVTGQAEDALNSFEGLFNGGSGSPTPGPGN